MGGGEVARYLTRHGASKIKQAVLIASIVPYMLKTADNPKGVEQSVFDGMAKSIATDRAAFWPPFFKAFYGVSLTSHPCQPGSARLVVRCLDAGEPARHARMRQAFSSHRPARRSALVHGADVDHPRVADQTVPIDPSARASAKGISGST